MNARERFLAAARGRPHDRPPVWLMRQAGRYLPEYREFREQYEFLELIRRPEFAAKVSLQPWERFGMDAVILFSDILVPLVPMGVRLSFEEGMGPRLDRRVTSASDLASLARPRVRTSLPFTFETMEMLRHHLGDAAALIGFVGGPWTMACYLIQGGAGDFSAAAEMAGTRPELALQIMELVTGVLEEYAFQQVCSGADAIQIFDTWGGLLGEERYRELALPFVRRIAGAVAGAGAVPILFVRESQPMLPAMRDSGAQVASLGARTDLAAAWKMLGNEIATQGNLDPEILLGPPALAAKAARDLVELARGRPGHIVNLGHGVPPEARLESVKALVDAVRNSVPSPQRGEAAP